MQVLEDELLDRNAVLEDRSRCNNLRFDGLTDDLNETWDDCERKKQDVLLKM